MLNLRMLLADIEPLKPDALPQGHGILQKNSAGGDILVILAVGFGLAMVLFGFVYLNRRKRTRRLGMVRSSKVLYRDDEKVASSSGRMKVRKKRRSHPDNFPRNPTLGETGGLPPLRPEEPHERAS